MKMLADTRAEMKKEFFEARDAHFEESHWQARKTYAYNYKAVEDMARSSLTDDISLYQWMGVSKAFPSDNRLSDDERESDKIGPTPSLKTLWQMSAGIGLHPVLFLTDDKVRSAVRSLAKHDQDPQEVDRAAAIIEQAEKTWERLEEAKRNDQKVDHREQWLDLIEGYAKDIACGSPGGILGARLGIESENPHVLAAMTRFGHFLGETTSEGLVSTDVFTTPCRKGPFSPYKED
jgi:transcriptional regulator with XRE-family HTH domain